jgi:hypothetical protein
MTSRSIRVAVGLTLVVAATAAAAVASERRPAAGSLDLAAGGQLTADQRLVAGLEAAVSASRAALGSLERPAAQRTQAMAKVRETVVALDRAAEVAPYAVGALDTPPLPLALRRARALSSQAAGRIAGRRYSAAGWKLRRAIELEESALNAFGRPLAKEFEAFAVGRRFHELTGFAGYSGISASAGAELAEVVIGVPNRATANGQSSVSRGRGTRPITALSVYVLSNELGFTTGPCSLESGLIRCRIIAGTMLPGDVFTVAFGRITTTREGEVRVERLEKGTKLLVTFLATNGDRSHALVKTR